MNGLRRITFTFAAMRTTAWLLALLTGLLMTGCLQDEVGGVRVATDTPLEVYSVPRQVAMTLFHAGGPWTASTSSPWIEVLKKSGSAGTDTLIIRTTEKNLTGERRLAQVIVESDGERQMVDVWQRDEYALFSENTFNLPAEGGLLDVTFRTNCLDSLQLYVTTSLVEFLEDTRKKDSVEKAPVRAMEPVEASLSWLRVLPNETDSLRQGTFFLSLHHHKSGLRVDLDTLHFSQAGRIPTDSVPAASE